jgi:hypothetical protein
MTSNQEPQGWTEARVSRAIAMAISGVVVVADVWLLVVFLRVANTLPGGLGAYWYILAGIAAVFGFALLRLRRHWRAFRAGE